MKDQKEFSAKDQRLAADEATWVGQAAGTPLQELSADALRVMATHYFDWQFNRAYDWKYFEQAGGGGHELFVIVRLEILAGVMGEEAFAALAAEKRTEWIQACAKADAALRALTPCVTCGRSRTLSDDFPENQGLCGDCR